MSNTKIVTVGIIGAGQMGSGIAQVCAASGYSVLLNDASPERIDLGLKGIEANLARRVKSGKCDEATKTTILSKISAAPDLAQFNVCDLVIEAAVEKEAVKAKIFEALAPHLKESCILSSNTSSISITRLAATTGRPERFMGVHFMNPAPVMELVELIRGIATDETVFQTINEFVKTLGKTTAVSEDFPAFIVNRILLPMINEAVYTLYEGVGNVEAIDTAMKLGAHHPMGPLELADFIGLDTCLSVMQVLHEGLSDSKYRPCPLLVKYVEAGWLGRKVKRGFYDYRGEKPVPTR
jgi:3-hydroxybutyryl-CoA dehydrogenase